MLKSCPNVFLTVVIIILTLSVHINPVFASHQCGNGSCQPSGHHNESCSTCPADCGVCPVPTPTPTPTITPTPTPTSQPSGEPSPTPTPNSNATSTSAPESSSSSSASQTYYPQVSIISRPQNPTNQTTLSYSGNTFIEQGTVSLVEYSVTSGATWIVANFSNGSYSFTTPSITEGAITILIRAKSQAGEYTKFDSYARDTVTIITTPPTVALHNLAEITNEAAPTIAARASSGLGSITKAEISLDNGTTWIPAALRKGVFQIKTEPLEDGNYEIVARAYDNAGNVGRSQTRILIVDTIPPIIGGVVQSLGPQILSPNANGRVRVVSGGESIIALSMKGGVTEAKIVAGESSFALTNQKGTHLWFGKLKFERDGEKSLHIQAIDGAGNKSERSLQSVDVVKYGKVTSLSDSKPLRGVKVSLFVFDTVSSSWVLWDSKSFGQENPQSTNEGGNYGFMIPTGKYYLEVQLEGFYTAQSEIMTPSEVSIINFDIALRSKPKMQLNLPIFGTVVLTIPSFSPPDTFQATLLKAGEKKNQQLLSQKRVAFEFSLPDLSGKDLSLSSLKGKKAVLTFIAPWSPLSQEQAPILSEISKALPTNQKLLAISLQESIAATQTFVNRGNYTFDVVVDRDGTVGSNYNITVLPEHVFINSSGQIQEVYNGILSKDELLKKLADLP